MSDVQEPATPTPAEPSAGSRAWMQRWRRITQPTPPDPAGKTPSPKHKGTLTDRSPFEIGFFGAFGVVIATTLWAAIGSVKDIIVLILLSLCIALGLNRAVEFLRKRGVRRGVSVVSVLVIVVGIIGLAIWALARPISEQVTQLTKSIPTWWSQLTNTELIQNLAKSLGFTDAAIAQATAWVSNPQNWFNILLGGGAMNQGVSILTTLGGLLFSLFITLVMTVYFLASLPSIKEAIYRMAPASRRPRVRYLASEMMNRVGGYIAGLTLQALIAAVATILYLTVSSFFGIPLGGYAIALGVMVAICWYIPIVGPTIAAVILTIIAFVQDTDPTAAFAPNITYGIVTLIFFLCYTQFDAYFTAPRIMSRAVQVPGIMVILAALTGATIIGSMIGAILAVPIMAALMLLYREVLIPYLDKR
ncbi:MAG: AI-2E family transporter [Propionibacteriaceae bacterium]|nr:AI-2E family transporter [Propionibacteriaceae bacterium]